MIPQRAMRRTSCVPFGYLGFRYVHVLTPLGFASGAGPKWGEFTHMA